MRCQLHSRNPENGFLWQLNQKSDSWKYNNLPSGICTCTQPRTESNGQKPIHENKTEPDLFPLLHSLGFRFPSGSRGWEGGWGSTDATTWPSRPHPPGPSGPSHTCATALLAARPPQLALRPSLAGGVASHSASVFLTAPVLGSLLALGFLLAAATLLNKWQGLCRP
eukprot:bmy_01949T0